MVASIRKFTIVFSTIAWLIMIGYCALMAALMTISVILLPGKNEDNALTWGYNIITIVLIGLFFWYKPYNKT